MTQLVINIQYARVEYNAYFFIPQRLKSFYIIILLALYLRVCYL